MTDENDIETEDLETETVEEVEVTEEIIIDKPESPQETAYAVYKELKEKAEAEEGKQEATEEKPNEISEAAKKLASAKKFKKRQTFVPAEQAQTAPTEKYDPPVGFPVEDKEWFIQQPPEIQKNAANWFKNAQGKTTKIWQDLNRELGTAKEINEVANEYFPKMKIPAGMTKGQVVKQLFEYQQKINEDSVGAIAEMIRHRGVTLEQLQEVLSGQVPARPQPVAQPQQNPLTEERILSILEQRDAQLSQQRAIDSATDEVRALGQEMQAGRFTWPEMHNPTDIQRIQPLISYFRETTPGLSWSESYKRAILQDRTNRGVGSPSPTSQRLSPTDIQNVRQASSSLRSRGGNGAIPRMSEPKSTETARESAEAAYYEVFGNKQH